MGQVQVTCVILVKLDTIVMTAVTSVLVRFIDIISETHLQ